MSNTPTSGFKGISEQLRGFPGVEAMHVRHLCQCSIGEHAHDWPCLVIPLIGSANEELEDGRRVQLFGPSAVFHASGSPHTSHIGELGQDALGIFLDPDWLRVQGFRPELAHSMVWQGGAGGALARRLARLWMRGDVPEATLRLGVARLLSTPQSRSIAPTWLPVVQDAIASDGVTRTPELARRVGLNAAWMARAYRQATGQGIQESVRLRRIESAVFELRSTDRPVAQIATEAGFCDQAHLHRWTTSVLGKTPGQLRAQARAEGGQEPPATDVAS